MQGHSRSRIQKLVRLRQIKVKWSSQRPPASAEVIKVDDPFDSNKSKLMCCRTRNE